MSTSPAPGITVYTTTQNTYVIPGGARAETLAVSPTGELAVDVFGPQSAPGAGDAPWLGSFGSVEAVYQAAAVVMSSPASARGGL